MGNIVKYRGFVNFLRSEIANETNLREDIPIIYINIRQIMAVYDIGINTVLQTSNKFLTINLPIDKVMERIDSIPMD